MLGDLFSYTPVITPLEWFVIVDNVIMLTSMFTNRQYCIN